MGGRAYTQKTRAESKKHNPLVPNLTNRLINRGLSQNACTASCTHILMGTASAHFTQNCYTSIERLLLVTRSNKKPITPYTNKIKRERLTEAQETSDNSTPKQEKRKRRRQGSGRRAARNPGEARINSSVQ